MRPGPACASNPRHARGRQLARPPRWPGALRQQLLRALELCAPRLRKAATAAIDEIREHPHPRAGTLWRDFLRGERPRDRRRVLREEARRGMRRVRRDRLDPAPRLPLGHPALSRASRLRAKLRLALVLAATLLASFLLEALHGLVARARRRLALLVPRSLLVHHGLPRDARKSRGGPLVDGDEPEDALVLQPRRAVDHRPEVEAVRPRIDRRAQAEAELRDLARRDGLGGRRRDPVVPEPVHRHAKAIRQLVVAVEAEGRLPTPHAALPGLAARVREADPEVGDLAGL